jgi:hypothetical protein
LWVLVVVLSGCRWRRFGLTTALVLMVGAAPALADTTIGNSTPGGNVGCAVQNELADNGYTVPAGGG